MQKFVLLLKLKDASHALELLKPHPLCFSSVFSQQGRLLLHLPFHLLDDEHPLVILMKSTRSVFL